MASTKATSAAAKSTTNNVKIGDTLQFEVVKRVTLPQFKLDESGEPNFYRIETAIAVAKDLQQGRERKGKDSTPQTEADKKAAMAPPDVAEVVDLKTGEPGMLIFNAVLKSNLTEKYPGDTYVGKCFQIRKFKPVAGKRYFTFEILEIKLKAK